MWLKKAAALGMTGMLVSAAFVMPVSAHGHHGRQAAGCGYDHDHLCEVCTVEDCARVGWHVHDGSTDGAGADSRQHFVPGGRVGGDRRPSCRHPGGPGSGYGAL